MHLFKISFVLSFLFLTIIADIYDEVKDSRNFTGKVVIVTGSSAGIGEGTVKLFSSLGASVVVTGRNQTNVHRVAEETQKLSPHGLKPLEVVADLSKEEDRVHLINETINKFGQIDVLVNNAGVLIVTFIKDSDVLSKFDNAFNVDVRASLHLIHLSLPYLQKSKGTIINLTAVIGFKPERSRIRWRKRRWIYLQKYWQLNWEVMALEAIAPGYIDSNNAVRRTEEEVKHIISQVPLQRRGTPQEIANGIVFLASSDAQYITGTSLIIDGGIQYNLVSNIVNQN